MNNPAPRTAFTIFHRGNLNPTLKPVEWDLEGLPEKKVKEPPPNRPKAEIKPKRHSTT